MKDWPLSRSDRQDEHFLLSKYPVIFSLCMSSFYWAIEIFLAIFEEEI